jgi:alkylation response protein AidB-like acyl-CoA dehydrogenase
MTMMAFTEEQEQLAEVLRELFSSTCADREGRLVRDLDAARTQTVQALTAAGMMGLPFPEELGGAGAGLVDTAMLFREGGRALCPSSVYTTLFAGLAIEHAASATDLPRWISQLASGEVVATIALWSPDDAHALASEITATDGPPGLTLAGTARFVENAPIADLILVAARTDDDTVTLALVRPGGDKSRVEPVSAMGRDPLGHLILDAYPVPTEDRIGTVTLDTLKRISETVIALQCIEMVGGATRVLDDTVAYIKQREQFGRPIGSFQAVQHIVADVRIAIDVARLTAWHAIRAAASGAPAERDVAVAKYQADKVYPYATLQCHQLWGGMGYIRESDLHLWSERAKVTELRGGSRVMTLAWLGADQTA